MDGVFGDGVSLERTVYIPSERDKSRIREKLRLQRVLGGTSEDLVRSYIRYYERRRNHGDMLGDLVSTVVYEKIPEQYNERRITETTQRLFRL